MLVKKVKGLSPALNSNEEYDKETAKLIMEQSIEHSWSSVYPLKERSDKNSGTSGRTDKEPPIGYKDEATDKIYLGNGKWEYDDHGFWD